MSGSSSVNSSSSHRIMKCSTIMNSVSSKRSGRSINGSKGSISSSSIRNQLIVVINSSSSRSI